MMLSKVWDAFRDMRRTLPTAAVILNFILIKKSKTFEISREVDVFNKVNL